MPAAYGGGLEALTRPYSRVSAQNGGGGMGSLRPCPYVIGVQKFLSGFAREMDRLWESAELGITPLLHRKLERQKIRCGDGVERG